MGNTIEPIKIPTEIPVHNIILLGNGGSGKSTLGNALNSCVKFYSGLPRDFSTNQGTTVCETYGKITDTPPLSAITFEQQKANGIEITKALKQNGPYVLVFVITVESGHISAHDLITMRIILNSLKNISDIKFGVVINKSSTKLTQNLDAYKKHINNMMSIKTEYIYAYDFCANALDCDNVLLSSNIKFTNFINSIPPIILNSENVNQIYPVEYERIFACFTELSKLNNEREEILKKFSTWNPSDAEIILSKIQDRINKVDKFIANLCDMRE